MPTSVKSSIPKKYVPASLQGTTRKKQIGEINKSRRLYKRGIYYTRKRVPGVPSRHSPHVKKAMELYGVESMVPSETLAAATGCSLASLEKIVNKGMGAYYSSGSRPNQTAQSWGIARLASSVSGGKSSAVDFSILEEGCTKGSRALKLARSAKRKYGKGTRRVGHIVL